MIWRLLPFGPPLEHFPRSYSVEELFGGQPRKHGADQLELEMPEDERRGEFLHDALSSHLPDGKGGWLRREGRHWDVLEVTPEQAAALRALGWD